MRLRVISSVVNAAASNDLTTIVNVKAELGLSDGANDAVLKRYISSASAAASQYCNRTFQIETIKDEIWPAADPYPWPLPGFFQTMQLSRWPVVTLASLTENGKPLTDGTDFRTDPAAGSLMRLDLGGRQVNWSAQPKVAQYDAGYAVIPVDLEDAVIRMVTRRFRGKGRDPSLKQRNIPGVIEQSWWIATGNEAGNLSPDVEDVLDNYRVPVTA